MPETNLWVLCSELNSKAQLNNNAHEFLQWQLLTQDSYFIIFFKICIGYVYFTMLWYCHWFTWISYHWRDIFWCFWQKRMFSNSLSFPKQILNMWYFLSLSSSLNTTTTDTVTHSCLCWCYCFTSCCCLKPAFADVSVPWGQRRQAANTTLTHRHL